MAELPPVTWPNLIKRLSRLGFDGPYSGGKHPYMIKGSLVLTVPNPHSDDEEPCGDDGSENIKPAPNDFDAGVDHPENEHHSSLQMSLLAAG